MFSGKKSQWIVLLCFAIAACSFVHASQIQERAKFTLKRTVKVGADQADEGNGDDNDSDDDDTANSKNQADDQEDEEEPEYEIAKPKSAQEKRLDAAKQKLAANLHEQSELEHRMMHLSDESSSDAEIDLSIKLVTNETQSPAMANMLGHVWKEMRMFEVPVYGDHVKDELKHLKRDERVLEAKLTTAQGDMSADHDKLTAQERTLKKKTSDKAAVKHDEENEENVEKSKVGVKSQSAAETKVSGLEAAIATGNFWGMHRSQQKAAFLNTLVYVVCGVLVAFLFVQARQRYPKVFVPVRRADVYACQNDFSFSIFGFLGDRNLCLLGCCCPCLAWADTLDRNDLLSFWKAFGAFFGLLILHTYTMGISSIFVVVIGVVFRQKLRAGYDMENGTPRSIGMDAFVWCFCQPCAIIQEAREETVVRNMVTAERVKTMESP